MPLASMRTESKPRQTSLRAFFGYLTLACLLMGMTRALSDFEPPPVLLFFLSVALFSSFGAALGSLFGWSEIGAVVGIAALFVLIFASLLPVSNCDRWAPSKYDRLAVNHDFQ
jgi:hypothetical protein